jgi:hypothetical protein
MTAFLPGNSYSRGMRYGLTAADTEKSDVALVFIAMT